MRRWEYMTHQPRHDAVYTTVLNQFGREGWELVDVNRDQYHPSFYVLTFKREVTDGPSNVLPNPGCDVTTSSGTPPEWRHGGTRTSHDVPGAPD